MSDTKSVKIPLVGHFKLSKEQSPKNNDELEKISKVPYASAIESLIYAMVYTRPDIAHTIGAMSRYMVNLGEQHWEAIK